MSKVLIQFIHKSNSQEGQQWPSFPTPLSRVIQEHYTQQLMQCGCHQLGSWMFVQCRCCYRVGFCGEGPFMQYHQHENSLLGAS